MCTLETFWQIKEKEILIKKNTQKIDSKNLIFENEILKNRLHSKIIDLAVERDICALTDNMPQNAIN